MMESQAIFVFMAIKDSTRAIVVFFKVEFDLFPMNHNIIACCQTTIINIEKRKEEPHFDHKQASIKKMFEHCKKSSAQ